jgi:excisionase family DNA binding protein
MTLEVSYMARRKIDQRYREAASPPPGIGHNNPPDTANLTLPFEERLGVSIDEAAQALDVHNDSIYRMIADSRLTASKMGRRTIVHVASIYRLMTETVIVPRRRVRRDTKPKPTSDPPATPPARPRHHRAGKAVKVLQAAITTP